MEWNVFYDNVNHRKIETLNIFKHRRFREDCEENLAKYDDKEEFAKVLKKDLGYYFWAKCEYEILIGPWPCHDFEKESTKVDIYTQVMNNWPIFLDYVWSHK